MKYFNAIKSGNNEEADAQIMKAQGQSITPDEIYISIFQPSAYEIGQLWKKTSLGLGRNMLPVRLSNVIWANYIHFLNQSNPKIKNWWLGCVDREYHRIGLRMVADLFEQDGWNVLYMVLQFQRKRLPGW